jgi:hypothetical protein
VGLGCTGSRAYGIPSTVAGAPSFSLPVLECSGLPFGLQVMGFRNRDADVRAAPHCIFKIILFSCVKCSNIASSVAFLPSSELLTPMKLRLNDAMYVKRIIRYDTIIASVSSTSPCKLGSCRLARRGTLLERPDGRQ